MWRGLLMVAKLDLLSVVHTVMSQYTIHQFLIFDKFWQKKTKKKAYSSPLEITDHIIILKN